jgi:hypothetical protein
LWSKKTQAEAVRLCHIIQRETPERKSVTAGSRQFRAERLWAPVVLVGSSSITNAEILLTIVTTEAQR